MENLESPHTLNAMKILPWMLNSGDINLRTIKKLHMKIVSYPTIGAGASYAHSCS